MHLYNPIMEERMKCQPTVGVRSICDYFVSDNCHGVLISPCTRKHRILSRDQHQSDVDLHIKRKYCLHEIFMPVRETQDMLALRTLIAERRACIQVLLWKSRKVGQPPCNLSSSHG